MTERKIAIIGLGYVGLPLALSFGEIFKVIGYDIDKQKIKELSSGYDRTAENDSQELINAKYLKYSCLESDLEDCNVYILTVPTPVDDSNVPDLRALINATMLVRKYLKSGDVVVFESTVYPGVTNDICSKILEKNLNNVSLGQIHIGYSPERINPGDKINKLKNVAKLVGCDEPIGREIIAKMYREIINSEVVECDTIKIAEGAKIIENVQRDINIGLVNELKMLFDHIDVDFEKVLTAALTKWNFMDFRPGLVGGHCIGVDPYYLTHLARSVGFSPELIHAGRRTNDNMAEYFAHKFVKKLINDKVDLRVAKVLIVGFAFKPNCADTRNTKVFDLLRSISDYNIEVDVFDNLVNKQQVYEEYNLKILQDMDKLNFAEYDAVLVAVEHNEVKKTLSRALKGITLNVKVYALD